MTFRRADRGRSALAVIEAPTNLGLMPTAPGREPGTRRAPDVLRELGLYDVLHPENVMRIDAPAYCPDEVRDVNVRNLARIAEHAIHLADSVEGVLRAGTFPLVLGGDCSLLVGTLLGLRRVRDAALFFIDGHADFYLPEQSGTGGAAGMDLALVTGWGPVELTNLEGRRPYVDVHRVAALGNRDHGLRPPADIPDIGNAGLFYRSLAALRAEGIETATKAALAGIGADTLGHWIHLDVDAIDSVLMPAVDSPQPDGLSWNELEVLLRTALDRNAIGLQVTIYDPDRDPTRSSGRALVRLLTSILA